MFELRRLRLLHELAQRGTLAAVAEALSYSPSTISQQLAQLERDAGVPLLVPEGRRVRYELADPRIGHALGDLLELVVGVDPGCAEHTTGVR